MADQVFPSGEKSTSINLLPNFYKTDANRKFLQATVDQLVQPGTVKKINGYIGRENSKATTGKDVFVQSADATRQHYQLEPGFVVKDSLGNTTFFKDYIDYINQLGVFGGNTTKHERVNSQEFYSWDPHIDWDKFVNFQNYYWVPYGPATIKIFGQQTAINSTYAVALQVAGADNQYVFTPDGLTPNPVLKLYRGQTYTFEINSPGNPFNIKIARTLDIADRYNAGVSQQGVKSGSMTFTVPADAPNILYYQSGSDLNLGGTLEIYDITADTYIDVETDVLGKKNYKLADGTSLSNGMKVAFGGNVNPSSYAKGEYYVEGVGSNIRLINKDILEIISTYTVPEAVYFDSVPFDSLPFADASGFASIKDYLIINRASRDHNPWSRYNRWFHKDVLEASAAYNNQTLNLDQTARAVRPIIEFNADLKLFNFGTMAVADVDIIDTFTTDVFSTIEGSPGYNVDGIPLSQGQLVLFTADTDRLVKNNIYQVTFVNISGYRQIHLEPYSSPEANQTILIRFGNKNQGQMYWYDDNKSVWTLGQQKTGTNQAPLFDVVDSNKISFGDNTAYPGSNFKGTSIFTYKKASTGTVDSNLGFSLTYKNISNVGDIVFNFTLVTDTFQYKSLSTAALITVYPKIGFLVSQDYAGNWLYQNGWQTCTAPYTQAAIRIYKDSGLTNNFPLDIFDDITNLTDLVVRVYINGIRLDPSVWTLIDAPVYKKIVLTTGIAETDILTIRAFSSQAINTNGYYEIPVNLQNNPLNQEIGDFTLGEVIDHVSSIVDNLTNFSGIYPGANNLRDLGNVTQYGTKFVQHSGPASLSLYHTTNQTNNIVRAIEKNREDYNNFKRNFISTATTLGIDTDPIIQVDLILDKINRDKSTLFPYYFSDMVPYGSNRTTSITVVDYRIKNYPLTNVFTVQSLSNQAVLVYYNSTQLLYGRDYEFNVQGFVTISSRVSLANGGTVTIVEYDSTDGCFVPETPTKLGLWPKYEPHMYLDTTLITPVIMIQGHDGSQFAAFNDYRDELILELECRIYNNIKINYDPSIYDIADVIPSYNRTNRYSRTEFDLALAPNFYKWATLVDKDFTVPVGYDPENGFTYNYSGHSAPDGTTVPAYWRGIYRYLLDTDRPNICPWEMLGFSIQPYWWTTVYGPSPYTSDNRVMWQDITDGMIRQPGVPAVKTEKFAKPFLMKHIPVDGSGNLVSPITSGLASGLVTYDTGTTAFVFGDVAPVEGAWRRSSHYPFSVIITSAILNPSSTIGVLLDRSRIVRNLAGQLVYSTTSVRITPADIVLPSVSTSEVRTQTAGLINYVVNYILSDNLKSYSSYQYDLSHITANLSHRIGAFTSKEKFQLILDSRNYVGASSVFVPQEDYSIVLNSSSPIKKITYSGVIVTKTTTGFEVKGYSQSQPYFYYYNYVDFGSVVNVGGISESYATWAEHSQYGSGSIVKYNGRYYRVSSTHTTITYFDGNYYQRIDSLPIVGGVNANFRNSWDRTTPMIAPYGTKFSSVQAVVDFLLGYGEYLKDQGFVFDEFNTNLAAVSNWETSAKEFMFWTTQNWSSGTDKWADWLPSQPVDYGTIVKYNGSYYRATVSVPSSPTFILNDFEKLDGLSSIGSAIISLSPSANKVVFNTTMSVVDDVNNPFNGYEIFKVDGTPIESFFINSFRQDNSVSYAPRGSDGIYGASFYLVQKEQIVILNNTTMFNDTIYNPPSGYKQDRIKVSGYVSIDWYGGFDVPGFIFDEAIINAWEPWTDYHLGDIVKYQQFYYSAKTFLQGTESFVTGDWVLLNTAPSAKLLPNWTYKAGQFTDFYSLDSDNFDATQQKVAQHIIGYQKRNYLDNIIQDDVSEFKFYQGMIREKGTQNVLNKLFDTLAADNLNSLTFFEEWALRLGQYGANGAFEAIEFTLNESQFKNNPQGFLLVDQPNSNTLDFLIRQTPADVYLKPTGYTSNPWPALVNYTPYLRSAGYVRASDVFLSLGQLSEITSYDITTFNNGSYIRCAFENTSWNVYRFTDVHFNVTSITYATGVLTITFFDQVTLPVGTWIGIAQTTQLNGFYQIASVSLNVVTVSTTILGFQPFTQQAEIVVYALISQRTSSIDNIDSIIPLKLTAGEKLWTDDAGNGAWGTWTYNTVYHRSILNNSSPAAGLAYGKNISINQQGTILGISTANGEVIVWDKASNAAPWIQREVVQVPYISGQSLANSASSIATVIAFSADGTWMATGTPGANYAYTRYVGTWNLLYTSYNLGDIMYNSGAGRPGFYVALQNMTFGHGIVVGGNLVPDPAYWERIPYVPVTSSGANSGLVQQGVISLYKKDANNIYTLVDTIISPSPYNNEKFGSSIQFFNQKVASSSATTTMELLVGAPGYGTVYKFNYGSIVETSSAYNPVGSSAATVVVTSTVDVFPGMVVTGIGFTKGQTVLTVVNSTTLILSGSPDSTPNGLLTFSIVGWIYNSKIQKSYNGSLIGYSIAVSSDGTSAYATSALGGRVGVVQVINNGITQSISGTTGQPITYQYTPGTYSWIYKVGSGVRVIWNGTIVYDYDGIVNNGNNWLIGTDNNVYYRGTANTADTVAYSSYAYAVGQNSSQNYFGSSIALSNDGTYLAIGDSSASGAGVHQGAVTVYKYVNGLYSVYQIISNHQPENSGNFGSKISFMSDSTLVIYSTAGDVAISTSFDSSKTTFDKSSTGFLTNHVNSGRIDIYDRYATKWVYSESLSTTSVYTDSYGTGFSVGTNHVIVGAPLALDQTLVSGLVYDYYKAPGAYTWTLTHSDVSKPDISKIKRAFLYNKKTGQLVTHLDYIDPQQGKVAGPAEEEITYTSFYDPAIYSVGDSTVNVDASASWTKLQVGKLWWDLRTAKFVNSYDTDPVYRNSSWNTLATGASIDIYEWVATSYLPAAWNAVADTESGLSMGISGISLYGNTVYSVSQIYDSVAQKFKNTYYYWVKNKKTIPTNVQGRNLSASDTSLLIANPRGENYTYLALTGTNSFSLVNAKPELSHSDVILSIEYWMIDKTDKNVHSQWKIINDDTLTVLPTTLEQKWFDSLCGRDLNDKPVPDLTLPAKSRYGIENRPRQGMFINRFEALKQFIEQANLTLSSNQIVSSRNISALYGSDPYPSTVTGQYDTTSDTDAELIYISIGAFRRPAVSPIITDGKITGIAITYAGSGYINAPYITIVGSGENAVVRANINSSGQIVGATIINTGSGYNSNTVATVRDYSVLVYADSQAEGAWSIYSYDPTYKIFSRLRSKTYDVTKYWTKIDWYASGFSQFSAADFAIDTLADLNTIDPNIGHLVLVRSTGTGGWQLLKRYSKSNNIDWTQSYSVVGIENGTIKLNSNLYSFANTTIGYDNSTFDGAVFDGVASAELKIILNTLKTNIFINELKQNYLDLFFTSVRYALSEQTYLDWIFKTSFVKANYNVGQLDQPVNFKIDNLSNFQSYIDEVKPYRTHIREYVSTYTKVDNTQTMITDFDLPPVYENGSLVQVGTYITNDKIMATDAAIQSYPWKNWLDNVGYIVTELRLVSGGSGYLTEPVVTINSASGSGATARAFFTNGVINRIILLTHGSGYLSAPTVTFNGGLSTTGVAARAVAIIGNSYEADKPHGVIRSALVKIKFDRTTQSYFITSLQQTEKFTGTGGLLQFKLKWAPDVRVGQSTVTINGVSVLRELYTLAVASSTTKGYTTYSGTITFATAPAIGAVISVTYINDCSILNAADRTQFYYSPITGEVGNDLAQLMTGIDYGGVIVNGLGFNTSAGWNSLPYYSDRWDSYDATYNDYVVTISAGTRTFTLPYIPAAGTQLNVYYVHKNVQTYTSDGSTLSYAYSFLDFNPTVTVSRTVATTIPTVSANTTGVKTINITSNTGIKLGDTITCATSTAVIPGTTVTAINGSTITINQILYDTLATGTPLVFTRTLVQPIDLYIYANGTINLTTAITAGNVITITGNLSPVRIDDPNYISPVITEDGGSATSNSPSLILDDNSASDVPRDSTADGGRALTPTAKSITPETVEEGGNANSQYPTVTLDDGVANNYYGSKDSVADAGYASNINAIYNNNAVLASPVADGVTATVITIPGSFPAFNGDQFIIRQSTSDGSIKPQDADYDTALSGGDLSYATATGLSPDDIIVDGDGFITPTSSPAPEELMPGQVVDAVAIKVFDQPNSGSANIKIDNYIADGVGTKFKISQTPSSSRAIIVKRGSNILTYGTDYLVDYNNKLVTFNGPPSANTLISIFSLGFNGSNILDLDYFVGDGTTLEFITKAPFLSNITSLVYLNGLSISPQLFKTDSTYTSANRVGLRFSIAPAAGSIINYIIVSGNQQTFAITKTEVIPTNGSATYTLQYPIGSSLPLESNMIVRVDQNILQGPNNSYFTIADNTLSYTIDATRYLPYSITIANIKVLANGIPLVLGQDYTIDLSGITVNINQNTYSSYVGKSLVVSITTTEDYFYDVATGQITFNIAYDNTHTVEVISSYKHDILDIQRTAVNVTSSLTLTPDTVQYFKYKGISAGLISLDRTVINDSYIWVIKNTTLLTPAIDYKLNDDKRSITLATSLGSNDRITLMTFGSNVLTSGIAYVQFKDMLNRVSFKRLSLNKRTRLVQPLYYNDTSIVVTDASGFDAPNPAANKPGIIEIRGERIEFFAINGNVLSSLRRGTLGTGTPSVHLASSWVQEIGPRETIPYVDTTVTQTFTSDGTGIVRLNYIPANANQIEVFVGGYDTSTLWAPATGYTVGTIVTIASYTYKCTRAHTSSKVFVNDLANWSFFVGNIRLKKSAYKVHNINLAPTSPEGDVTFPADFTVDGKTNVVTLTNPLAIGTQITVVKRQGTIWDSKTSILVDDTNIGRFMRAVPGVWYQDSKQVASTKAPGKR